MPRDLYDCTAAELATRSVEHLGQNTPPSDAAAWQNSNGYDAAPVYAGDDPIGFIHKHDVTTDDDGDTLDNHLTPLTIDYMISGDTSFTDILSAVIEQPVFFKSVIEPESGIVLIVRSFVERTARGQLVKTAK